MANIFTVVNPMAMANEDSIKQSDIEAIFLSVGTSMEKKD